MIIVNLFYCKISSCDLRGDRPIVRYFFILIIYCPNRSGTQAFTYQLADFCQLDVLRHFAIHQCMLTIKQQTYFIVLLQCVSIVQCIHHMCYLVLLDVFEQSPSQRCENPLGSEKTKVHVHLAGFKDKHLQFLNKLLSIVTC